MPYYQINRKITVVEQVIVKANSVHEAFIKAGEDDGCLVRSVSEEDYEPDYPSIFEMTYISDATREQLDEMSEG